MTQQVTRPQSRRCPFISPFTSGGIRSQEKKQHVLVHSESKSPTGKLDFLSNLWALQPSTASGQEGHLCTPAFFSYYLHQWADLSFYKLLPMCCKQIGVIDQWQRNCHFPTRCVEQEHHRGRDYLEKVCCWCCTPLYNDAQRRFSS